jgi:magnesium transporter
MTSEETLVTEFFLRYSDEAAALMERLPPEEAVALLREIPGRSAAAVAARMGSAAGTQLLSLMSPAEAGSLLAEMPLKVAANLLRRIETSKREVLLASLPEKRVRSLRLLLAYPAGTVGSAMDPLAPVLTHDDRVCEALDRLRREPESLYYYVYVVDREQRLVGVLDLRELMASPPESPLADVMQRNLVVLRPRVDLAAVIRHPAWAEYDALPVVDDQGIFLGMIRQRFIRGVMAASDRRESLAAEWDTLLGLAELYWVGMRELTELMAMPLTRPRSGSKAEDRGASQ